ncbi:uncharacterized protein BROUX77_005500 [Berkeleyomyces rouxiae]|uniref:uncharacterized protein n=1 Tax=Berkeleyomyces rouxiae TaxID=2035830 RepID=UPI003B76DB92
MLPEPTLSFTLQSLHDETPLDCRIYHPQSLSPTLHAPPWRRHTAIFAHPYAPLGGSYDDRIVETVATLLLRQGYLVGTFNFRGAGSSYGLMLLGGYSYGSLITLQLPPLPEILNHFVAPAMGTAAAEIRTRAKHLAMNQNAILSSMYQARLSMAQSKAPRRSLGMRVGGVETIDRRSHESRRSLSLEAEEKLRRGLTEVKAKLGHRRWSRDASRRGSSVGKAEVDAPISISEPAPKVPPLDVVSDIQVPNIAFILVSPLQGAVSNLATFSLFPTGLFRRRSPFASHQSAAAASEAAERKLWQQPTLAIYGDKDVFVSVAKLRSWHARLSSKPNSRFQGKEIPGAGHFWTDEETLQELQVLITGFIGSLIQS